MKKIFFSFLFLFVFVDAQIIESGKLSDIEKYIKNAKETLVVFDIDNTLAAPAKELGSDEWFSYLVDQKMKEGFDLIQAINLQLPKYFYAQFNVPMELLESSTPNLLNKLNKSGVELMALTARSLYIAERTVDQLHNIDIKFSINEKVKDYSLSLPIPAIFKDGILFSGNNDKGEALISFFDANNYHPKKVIFIDDKHKNILAVENALLKRQIDFVGIRYSGADEKVKNFNPAAAEQQFLDLQNYQRKS